MSTQEYQKQYYLKNRDYLRKKHRLWAKKHKADIKANPLLRSETYTQPQVDVNTECPVCHDTIVNPSRKAFLGNKIMVICDGCKLWLESRLNRKLC